MHQSGGGGQGKGRREPSAEPLVRRALGPHIDGMYEKYWGTIITTEALDSPDEASDPSQPKLILRTLYKPAKVVLGIGLIAGLPHFAEACERGAYPFTDRCAPLADLPEVIKLISSTSTDSLSASMIASQPRLTFTTSAPNSSDHLISPRIVKPIAL